MGVVALGTTFLGVPVFLSLRIHLGDVCRNLQHPAPKENATSEVERCWLLYASLSLQEKQGKACQSPDTWGECQWQGTAIMGGAICILPTAPAIHATPLATIPQQRALLFSRKTLLFYFIFVMVDFRFLLWSESFQPEDSYQVNSLNWSGSITIGTCLEKGHHLYLNHEQISHS